MSNVVPWPIVPKSIPDQVGKSKGKLAAEIEARKRAKRLREGLDFMSEKFDDKKNPVDTSAPLTFDASVRLALISYGYAKTLEILREWVGHLENVVEKDGT